MKYLLWLISCEALDFRFWLVAELFDGLGILLLLGLNRIYSAKVSAYGIRADYDVGCRKLLLMTHIGH
jgi:hypothetical protein